MKHSPLRSIAASTTFFLSYRTGFVAVALLVLLGATTSVEGQQRHIITGHVPPAVAHLKAVGALPAANRLRLVIGLPLRNQTQLESLLNELNDPVSTNYHRWLTPGQFTERFGPTEADYQKVIHFASASGFEVTGLTANRMLVDVEAPVTNIEKALHLTLRLYPHPTENRNFYAPDTDPSMDTNVSILHISGLDNFTLPHPLGALKVFPLATNNGVTPYYTGSAPGGYFMGNDFRAAYVPGVTNAGTGQYVAIADVGGLYYPNDIYIYETNAGLSTNIVVTNIVTTFTSSWTNALTGSSTDDGEEALDICMAMSMAPGATIMNYEGDAHDVFNQIALDNKAKQITLSYGFGIDVSIIQSFQQFLAQGQALSQASGDGDADLNGGTGLTGNPYATIVGGTTLTTSGPGGPWSSETTWNWNNNGGSGGGISGYGIPNWQQGAGTSANQGSTVYRNYPDVAMPADGVFLVSQNGTSIGWVGGTSCASPLWAGFMALVNQQAASLGQSAVGFPNPAIYAIGEGPYAAYTNTFHDITTGNNFNSQNPTRFPATPGYDLCTGWGTPRGSNTIAALAGAGTNDFAVYASQGALNFAPGGVATTTLSVTRMNGFNGTINFSISGLPAGVAAVFSPASTTNSSLLTLAVGNPAVAGTNLITITGTSGTLTHSIPLRLTIVAPIPGATQVSLSSLYNRSGIWSDGRTFSGGLDGGGYAYSANLLGTAPSWNGITFNLGPANAADAVSCSGQTIILPAGNFTSLQILGTAVDGSQSAQNFTVTYTDNSTATLTQSFSDWAYPQDYAGESLVVGMAYRNNGGGSKDLYTAVSVYDYSLTLDQTRTVKSLTLPNNANVVILAVALANEPVTVPLASYYNRAGIYTDETTFTNPPTGGIDGSGYAYSATLLTGSQIWSNTLFNFGPANVTNVVSAASQTIPLPAGNYAMLRMLATGVQGSQAAQTFSVKYADGSTTLFVQSLSDWFSPQNYIRESKAILMGHRNVSNGTADNRTFYLYGYSFSLNSSKVVQSIQLPNDANVIVTAISLVPNWPPVFIANPFSEPDVMAGQNYSANISTNASDLDGDALTFAEVSGPAWLNVSTSGALSGTPLSAQVGANSFLVSVTDPGGLSNTATLNINVMPAPQIVSSITNNVPDLVLMWTGGIAPFQVEMSTDLTTWINIGGPISSNLFMIAPTNPAAFYRIVGQ
ncbi:MAG: protease pro-enzyme activation domain-containing protein [Verrucomicrobiota bacterium]|jgi:hypothetical protein